MGSEGVGPWSSHGCGGRVVLILWEPVQTDQPPESAETEDKSLHLDRTYMRPLREEVDSIVELSPIYVANLRRDFKFFPPNTDRIAGFGDIDDIHNGNFSRVATPPSVPLCASVADERTKSQWQLERFRPSSRAPGQRSSNQIQALDLHQDYGNWHW